MFLRSEFENTHWFLSQPFFRTDFSGSFSYKDFCYKMKNVYVPHQIKQFLNVQAEICRLLCNLRRTLFSRTIHFLKVPYKTIELDFGLPGGDVCLEKGYPRGLTLKIGRKEEVQGEKREKRKNSSTMDIQTFSGKVNSLFHYVM